MYGRHTAVVAGVVLIFVAVAHVDYGTPFCDGAVLPLWHASIVILFTAGAEVLEH